jgi:hypothetical protein
MVLHQNQLSMVAKMLIIEMTIIFMVLLMPSDSKLKAGS